MKHLSTLLAVVATGCAVFCGAEWWRTRALLRAAVPAGRPAGAVQFAARPSAGPMAADSEELESQLRAQDQELANLRQHLAQVSAALAHERANAARSPVRALDDGTLVYGPGARITLPNRMVVSSPTGTMVSDASQTHIDGDLRVETPNGQEIKVEHGYVSVESSHVSISGGEVTVTAH